MAASETLYDRLRRLAVEDPKTARSVFLEAFEANDNHLAEFLERVRKPGESRLRQVVANAVRAHPQKTRLVPRAAIVAGCRDGRVHATGDCRRAQPASILLRFKCREEAHPMRCRRKSSTRTVTSQNG